MLKYDCKFSLVLSKKMGSDFSTLESNATDNGEAWGTIFTRFEWSFSAKEAAKDSIRNQLMEIEKMEADADKKYIQNEWSSAILF